MLILSKRPPENLTQIHRLRRFKDSQAVLVYYVPTVELAAGSGVISTVEGDLAERVRTSAWKRVATASGENCVRARSRPALPIACRTLLF